MNTTINTTIDPEALRAKIDHMQKVLSGEFKPDETQSKIEKFKKDIQELADSVLKNKVILFNHFRLADVAFPEFKPRISDADLYPKLRIVLSALQGASGTVISDFIDDYRIDSLRIEEFRKDTFKLKRTGDGTNTLYWLATPEETKQMQEEAEKEAQAAEAAEQAAKQVVTKAKAKAKGRKKK